MNLPNSQNPTVSVHSRRISFLLNTSAEFQITDYDIANTRNMKLQTTYLRSFRHYFHCQHSRDIKNRSGVMKHHSIVVTKRPNFLLNVPRLEGDGEGTELDPKGGEFKSPSANGNFIDVTSVN